MSATVEHTFKKGFILGEEHIRKINEIVGSRFGKANPDLDIKPCYKIFRGDAYSYNTEKVDDVINEDNDGWKTIKKLHVLSSNKDIIDLNLEFSTKGVSLAIEGENRDEVFLLFSDLKDYMNSEITTRKIFPENLLRFIFIISPIFIILITMPSYFENAGKAEKAQVALKSTNITEKINYLIEERINSQITEGGAWIWFIFFIAFIALIATDLPQKIFSYVYPSNIFLLGKEKDRYNKRISLVNKIIWGVFIAFLVGMAGSTLVWYFTSKT